MRTSEKSKSLIPLLLTGLLALVGLSVQAAEDSAESRMRRDLTYLASDDCEGRGVATQGIHRAADYIAKEFRKAGLQPAGQNGSYFQSFTIAGGTLEADPRFVLYGPQGQKVELKPGKHFQPLGLSHSGKVTAASFVFVGYGITAAKDVGYDDYKDVDVAGKIVIVLRDTPRVGNKYAALKGDRRRQGSLMEKMVNAQQHKAAAILFVNDRTTARTDDSLMNFSMAAPAPSPARMPALHISRAVADALLKSGCDRNLRELEEDIDRELKPRSMVLHGWKADLETKVRRKIDAKNIVGVLEGSGPLARETVVIGAHYDHLGYGGPGSLANLKKPVIHYGADDNGSGTTALMELARRFGKIENRPGRRLVFIAFSGEEIGLLGSLHYCKNPLFSLADTVAMVNLDMVGRLTPDKATKKGKLQVWGTGTAKSFDSLIENLNRKYDFKLQKKPTGYGPSDHASFYAKQVPVLFLFTGDHADYHRPSDTVERINFEGMTRIVNLTEELVEHLSKAPEKPEYQKMLADKRPNPGQVPRIGIRPDYGDDQDGVLLSGVVDGGPADKAGLKEGDRIVDIGGKPVKDVQTYMSIMGGLKKGQPIELGILRDGKKLTVTVLPE